MQKCFTQNFNGKNTTFLYFSMLYPTFRLAKVPPQSCIFATLKPSKTTKTPSEPPFTIPRFAPATHQQLHQQLFFFTFLSPFFKVYFLPKISQKHT